MSHWPCSINLNDSKEKIKKKLKSDSLILQSREKQWTNASQVITVKMYRGTRIYPPEFEKFLVWNFWIVPFSEILAKNFDKMNFEKMAVKIRVKIELFLDAKILSSKTSKLGCVVMMIIDSILPHAEFGPNDH